jgi:hypothetical protein
MVPTWIGVKSLNIKLQTAGCPSFEQFVRCFIGVKSPQSGEDDEANC